jgi:hypothetical protein
MTVTTDPLADDYLRRLDAAASALPAHRRQELVSEIRGHLQEGLRQAPASDETAVRNLLERLGPPEEIVSAATDPAAPTTSLLPSGRPTVPPSYPWCWACCGLPGSGPCSPWSSGTGHAGRSRTQQAARRAPAWPPPASSSAGSGSPSWWSESSAGPSPSWWMPAAAGASLYLFIAPDRATQGLGI